MGKEESRRGQGGVKEGSRRGHGWSHAWTAESGGRAVEIKPGSRVRVGPGEPGPGELPRAVGVERLVHEVLETRGTGVGTTTTTTTPPPQHPYQQQRIAANSNQHACNRSAQVGG